MTIEYTAFERPRRLASAIHMPAVEIAGTLGFDPVANGTRMGWSWVVRPRGLYRLLTPVIARVGRRQERENWGGLKRFLEARAELAPEAS
jgi:hypothetical protein